jgi:hypothetical protein
MFETEQRENMLYRCAPRHPLVRYLHEAPALCLSSYLSLPVDMSRDVSSGDHRLLITTKAVHRGSQVQIFDVIGMPGSAEHLVMVCVAHRVRRVSRMTHWLSRGEPSGTLPSGSVMSP